MDTLRGPYAMPSHLLGPNVELSAEDTNVSEGQIGRLFRLCLRFLSLSGGDQQSSSRFVRFVGRVLLGGNIVTCQCYRRTS